MTLDARECYRALVSRDPRFDGRFFTGVTTTGIYCRPVCPSRTPKARHVRFFACAAAAQAAGYRPCLRCRPEAAPGTPAWSGASAVVRRALRLIEGGALDGSTVDALAPRLGLGERQLRRLFREHVGASPADVARARRVDFAKTLLDETELSITDVAHAAGFGSIRQFNDVMRDVFGRAPRELRRAVRTSPARGHGVSLRLAYRPPYDWRSWLADMNGRCAPGVESADGDGYRRTVVLEGRRGVLDVRRAPGEDALRLTVGLEGAGGLMAAAQRVRRMCDLTCDPAVIAAHLGVGPLLRGIVRRRGGRRLPGAWDPFEVAVRAVVGQQVSVAAATTLVGRLVRACGEAFDAAPGLTHLFPTAEAVAEADLSAIGLPSRRADALRRMAGAVRDGTLILAPHADPDDVRRQLMAIPGIGSWTAEYVALRGLGDPDAFPAGDLVLRRAAGHGSAFSSADLETLASQWRPWRGYAAVYLWAMAGAGNHGGRRPSRKGGRRWPR